MIYDREFVVEMFLDDAVSTTNRMIVATADVVNENTDNLCFISNALAKEDNNIQPESARKIRQKLTTDKPQGNFYEYILKNFTDNEYLINFKMLKSTVQELIDFLHDYSKPETPTVPFDKKVHVFLYLITGNWSFSEVSKKFGLHKSSVSYIFHEIAYLLSENRYQYINWPSLDEQHVTKVKVNSRFGFPNCVGFIDACRLKVGSKRGQNSKFKTILLQGVCNESLMFIDVFVGDIDSSTKKNRLFKESSLCHELKNLVEFENHILGDSEYKLKKCLITPFSSNEPLNSDEIRFNEVHRNSRSYIGHAFQMLLNRFSKLRHIDFNKVESVRTLIYAACVLHNFILIHEGTNEVKEETVLLNIDGVTIDSDLVKTASEKRQFLCNYINIIDGN